MSGNLAGYSRTPNLEISFHGDLRFKAFIEILAV